MIVSANIRICDWGSICILCTILTTLIYV